MGKETKKEELPVYEVLNKIKEKTLDPALLTKETRQLCIEALMIEGYGSSQIASLLKKSDRTIRRDLADIRKNNSISASPEFAAMIGGELLTMARSQYSRLKQLARSNDVETMDRAKVEYMSWLILKELTEKLHKIGFLTVAVRQNSSRKSRNGQDLVVEIEPEPKSEIDPAMQKIYAVMSPMDRERLIEKLHKDILESEKEEENASSPPPA